MKVRNGNGKYGPSNGVGHTLEIFERALAVNEVIVM